MKGKDHTIGWYLSNMLWIIIQRVFPSKLYLSIRYRLIFGRWIDWDNPRYFTEKLQWLKLYYYGEKEAHLVDKVKSKDYVSQCVGEQYVLPLIGAWESAKDIPFGTLPKEYVLKCNHDCGSVFFCKEEQPINEKIVRKDVSRRLRKNYYWSARETPYKYVKPLVFAEPLMKSSVDKEIYDYKFFCFDGEPKLFKIDFNRFVEFHSNYYDMDGHILPFGVLPTVPVYSKSLPIPENLSEMIDIARKLSQGLPFARVDLYNPDGKIIVGEITLFPTAGFKRFTDDEWDLRIGSMLNLPIKTKRI